MLINKTKSVGFFERVLNATTRQGRKVNQFISGLKSEGATNIYQRNISPECSALSADLGNGRTLVYIITPYGYQEKDVITRNIGNGCYFKEITKKKFNEIGRNHYYKNVQQVLKDGSILSQKNKVFGWEYLD